MFAVDVCRLPVTGGSTFVVAAGLFMLIAGVIVTRWVRASAGRMSVVVAPLVLLGGLVLAPSVTDPCSPATTIAPTVTTIAPTVTTIAATTTTTTVAPTTTVVPVDPNLVLEIDTTLLAPTGIDSVTAADESFDFELGLLGDVDVHIDWGDGSTDEVSDAGPFPHTYTTSGSYTITVSGSLTGLGQQQSDPMSPLRGAEYLRAVRSFGELGITSLTYAFFGAVNLVDVPSTLPATVRDMSYMFFFATAFNQSLNSWVTGSVTDMSYMFDMASSFDGDVSGWVTGSVTDMSYMFFGATAFNQSLSGWDTGSVTDMSYMFYGATTFNQSLSGWDIKAVVDMTSMLDGSALSVANYDATLNGWADTEQAKQSDVTLGAAGLSFSNIGSLAHSVLTGCGLEWQITDAGNQDVAPMSLKADRQLVTIAC